MRLEHFALNVPDARAHAQWLVQHLGFSVVRARPDAPYTHFLADDSGRVVVELYSNTKTPFPDYAGSHPLSFHFAVVSSDAHADRHRLEAAGATHFLDEPQPDGSQLVMLRDPWGVPLQLCQRAKPF